MMDSSVRENEAALGGRKGWRKVRSIRKLEEKLARAKALNEASRAILESAGDGIYCLDEKGLVTFANPITEVLTGWSREEMLQQPQHALIHHSHPNGDPYDQQDCPIYAALRDGQMHHEYSEVFWRKDGTSFPVAYTSTPILRDNQPAGAVVVFRDISEKKRASIWEKEKTQIFRAITGHRDAELVLAMIANAYMACHPQHAIAFHLRCEDALRLAAQAGIEGRALDAIRELAMSDESQPTVRAARQLREIEAGGPEGALLNLGCAVCDRCWVLPLISDAGELQGTVSVWRNGASTGYSDYQEHVRAAADMGLVALEHSRLYDELRRQSQRDALTGLPNRVLLEDRLEQAIKQARRSGTMVAVCYLDLDRFKQVNDTRGHAVGDALLRHVASVLRSNLREFDTITRQGGDEFILVLPEVCSAEEAQELCRRIAAKVGHVVKIGHHELKPMASIGISVSPAHGILPCKLLKRADMALYHAKHGGRNRIQIFEEQFERENHWNSELQNGLPLALERNEFSLDYQPLYDAEQNLVAFEALLRWHHPTLGLVGPDRFIPIAEETDLISTIGDWVLQQACGQALIWNSGSERPLRMLVNISGVQLAKPGFASHVAAMLNEMGLDPRLLELEITETWYFDVTRATSQLQSLRRLGVGISIDDFGSGHATFNYLQDLPADTVKLDRSFVARLDGTARGAATVHTIIELAKQLGMKVVAEGVETEEQRKELVEAGCPLMQGFLLSKPLPAAAATQLIITSKGSSHRGSSGGRGVVPSRPTSQPDPSR